MVQLRNLVFVCALAALCVADEKKPEPNPREKARLEEVKLISKELAGGANFIAGGEVIDIITRDNAIQVRWLDDWPDGIGRGVYGATVYHRPCALYVLTKDERSLDLSMLTRCRRACARLLIKLVVRDVEKHKTVLTDFEPTVVELTLQEGFDKAMDERRRKKSE